MNSNLPEDNKKELYAALVKVQATLKKATKESENPHFRSRYADLTSVWDACRDALTANGFCILQTTQIIDNNQMALITTLGHISGQSVSGAYVLNPERPTPQGLGSAMTYARRFSLAAMVGVVTEEMDDDGEASMDRRQTPQNAPQSTPIRPPVKSPLPGVPVYAATTEEPYQASAGDVVVPFGNDKGKRIKELPTQTLQSSLAYWNDRLKAEGKSATGALQKYLIAMEQYLAGQSMPEDPRAEELFR